MFETVFDGSNVTFLIAYIGGFITFFASCLLPLVPTYLAYLAGITVNTKQSHEKQLFRRDIFLNGLLFTIGFITVFVLLGMTVNSIGRLLSAYRIIIQRIGGIFFIIMGVFMLELYQPWFLLKERKIFKNFAVKQKYLKLNSFLTGMTFGFAWTPCIGPVLAVILFWASQMSTAFEGFGLLLFYGLGLGTPFLLTALLFEYIAPKLTRMTTIGKVFQFVSAIVIISVGILLITGKVALLSIRLLQLFNLDSLAI